MLTCQCVHAGHAAACPQPPHFLRSTRSPITFVSSSCIRTQRSRGFRSQLDRHHSVRATESTEQPQTQPEQRLNTAGQPDRRGLLAGAAVLLGAGGFLATRSGKGVPTFASLEKGAIDLDTALANGKPTIIEFYAAW